MEEHLLNNCIDVLIIGRFVEGTGNNTTANRIRHYLQEHGWTCQLKDCDDNFADVSALNQFVVNHNVLCILGIHAFRAGKLLRGVSVPFSIIFGGTDINEYGNKENCRRVISEAVSRSSILVAFSQTMVDKARNLLPGMIDKRLLVIPQGVVTKPLPCTDRTGWLSQHGLPANGQLFTMVAGLRPVKDPLFLVPAFADWQQSKQSTAYLVIVGPRIDVEFSVRFVDIVASQPSVMYIGTLSVNDLHRLLAHSFALVNSSISEGMSASILEAMDLGVPVIARDIPGNRSIVNHMQTGLLFTTPQDFIAQCELILDSTELRDRLIANARLQVQLHHSSKHEKLQYITLVDELIRTGTH